MRLRDQTPDEAADLAVLRYRLSKTHGQEGANAPLLTEWMARPNQAGGFRLHGLCWGSAILGDTVLTTTRIVEMTATYARTETGSLYLIGREDPEHRRERTMRGRRGPLIVAPAPEPAAAPRP